MYFVFVIETRHKSVSYVIGKIIVTRKDKSKLFLCGYFTAHYSLVKCRQKVNLEEIDTEPSRGKNDGLL